MAEKKYKNSKAVIGILDDCIRVFNFAETDEDINEINKELELVSKDLQTIITYFKGLENFEKYKDNILIIEEHYNSIPKIEQ